MTRRRAPRLALALLEHFVPDSDSLAGDLIEELERRKSNCWFWWQVLGAVATAWFKPPAEIRPLRLVDLQPADALERSRRFAVRFRPVNLSASPVADVGGLGLLVLALLVTVVVPGAWLVLLGSSVAGAALGVLLVAIHAKSSAASTSIHVNSLGVR